MTQRELADDENVNSVSGFGVVQVYRTHMQDAMGHRIDESALREVVSIVETMRSMQANMSEGQSMELEARVQSNRGGLTRAQLEGIVGTLVSAEWGVFEDISPWQESRDVFYRLPQSNEMVRGEMHMDSDNLVTRTQTIYKTRVRWVDLQSNSFNVRITLSKESLVPPELIPDMVTPVYVRIKQRRSFVRCSSDESAKFSYDVTQSWSGNSMREVETHQISAHKDPMYEFEIEHLYSHCDMRPEWVASSLILKVQDFMHGEYLKPRVLQKLAGTVARSVCKKMIDIVKPSPST